jgi:hypothetical protein
MNGTHCDDRTKDHNRLNMVAKKTCPPYLATGGTAGLVMIAQAKQLVTIQRALL